MQSVTFLVLENNGKVPAYNVIPSRPGKKPASEDRYRGSNIDKLFPSHGKPIIHMNQIQNYKFSAVKGLTPNDPQFPLLPNTPGVKPFWFLNSNEPRVDLSVYESNTDEYTNQFHGFSGKS